MSPVDCTFAWQALLWLVCLTKFLRYLILVCLPMHDMRDVIFSILLTICFEINSYKDRRKMNGRRQLLLWGMKVFADLTLDMKILLIIIKDAVSSYYEELGIYFDSGFILI